MILMKNKQAPGFEPGIRGLQPRALPLGHACVIHTRNLEFYKSCYTENLYRRKEKRVL